MDYLYENLETKNWDIIQDGIPTIKSYINLDSNDKIIFTIVALSSLKNKIENNFDMSILNLVGYSYKKIAIFELSLYDTKLDICDILVGFLPHKDAISDTIVKIILEPKQKLFSKQTKIELITNVNKNGFTPFLYNSFPFPRISFASWNIKFFTYNSSYLPSVLCANIQTFERRRLHSANIFLPFMELLFPEVNKYREAPGIVLPNIRI